MALGEKSGDVGLGCWGEVFLGDNRNRGMTKRTPGEEGISDEKTKYKKERSVRIHLRGSNMQSSQATYNNKYILSYFRMYPRKLQLTHLSSGWLDSSVCARKA
jgi:hypothetical protein